MRAAASSRSGTAAGYLNAGQDAREPLLARPIDSDLIEQELGLGQRRRLTTTTYMLSIDPSLAGPQATSSSILQQMQGVNETQLFTAIGAVARIIATANVTSRRRMGPV